MAACLARQVDHGGLGRGGRNLDGALIGVALDKHPRGRVAGLAGIGETEARAARHGGVDIRVVENEIGDLPPSSSDTVLTVSAAALLIRIPARVEPVKDTTSISGCEDRIVPTPGPSPLTMLNTPAGTPASCMISANRMLDIGAISEGFSTMVHPPPAPRRPSARPGSSASSTA